MKCRSVRSISYFLLLGFLAFIIFTQNVAALEFYKNESNATTSATGTTALEKLSLTLNKLVASTDAIIKSILGASPEATQTIETIEIRDSKSTPVISDIKTYDETRQQKKMVKTSSLSVADIPDKRELEVDAIASKNVAVKLKVNTASRGEVILDDFGKNNPVPVPLPGRIVKYLEIGARNISFSSANVTIRYSDAELNGGNEYDLTIYHWNGVSWDALPTNVDMANKTLSASTTSLSPFGVATSFIYYLENNATVQSVGANGNTNFSASGATILVLPYKNLLKNATAGTQANIGYTTASRSVEYQVFLFYLPYNYSVMTQISANIPGQIRWRAVTKNTKEKVNISLINYNPVNGVKTAIGNAVFSPTGGTTPTNYLFTLSNPQYNVSAGNRLMLSINTTTGQTAGTVALYFNDTVSSFINVIETRIGSGVKITNNSALSSTTLAGTNSTYFLNLTNNGTATDTYNITVSNPDGASINATNITQVTLAAGASKVFALNVTNTSSGTFKVNVTATSTNDATKFAYVNTTTTVSAVRAVSLSVNTITQETSAGTNATYILNLTNEGSETDTYTITSSNPDNAAIAGTNLTSVTLGAGAGKVFNLNVNNPYPGDFRINVTATSETDPTEFGYINTTTTVIALATNFIYYLENNNTIQSLGADGNTEYSASGTAITLSTRPYINLLKNGTMGTNANIRFTTTSRTTEYELFRFYQPFNYTMDTRISANSTFNISWLAANANNRLNVSLIDYNPATGEKKIIGIRNFTATGGTTRTTYGYQINHSAYTISKGNRLMFRINTTTPTTGTVRLYFNSYISNITVSETQIGGGVNLTSISALTNTTLAGTNSTYFLNLTNNGTASDTYVITVSNPNGASIFAANITPVTLDAGASKVFTLNVTNTSANATSFHVNVTATALNSSQSGYINTTTTVIAARVNLTNISALSNTTLAGTNSTYYLNLINNGTAPDTYIIITSNPDNAAIATTNITSVTLVAGASKVFAL
ncbi:MAG: hypothetical protein O8C67_16880, partial [Candidatus Methanoperedens sp.]|nr:hypothetical protein [Candidatus Methanoperedens sp.]